MQGIRKRLEAAGHWDPVVATCFEELQAFGIDQVSNHKAREALLFFLTEVAPLEFFIAPASRGQHHPKWQNQRGGILRNTVECCLGIDRKMRIFPELVDSQGRPRPEDRDILLIATILSDTFKHVDMEGESKGFAHHRIAAQQWEDVARKHNLDGDFSRKIRDAIFWHLGRFTPEWKPEWTDPMQKLTIHSFLVHMLDMDFSNKDLERIFVPKSPVAGEGVQGITDRQGSPTAGKENLEFLRKEFDTAHSYFIHVETKLSTLVTSYSTLFVAATSASYYILTSDNFKVARPFWLAGVAVVFFLLGAFILGMYTELRTRKIRTLEQMAIIREFFSANIPAGERDISNLQVMIKGIRKCPPYLRRPSEDWYTIVLMILVDTLAVIVALSCLAIGLGLGAFLTIVRLRVTAGFAASLLFVAIFSAQYRWTTLFAFALDCDREVQYGAKPAYDFFKTIPESFVLRFAWLDKCASGIENRNRDRLLRLSKDKYRRAG